MSLFGRHPKSVRERLLELLRENLPRSTRDVDLQPETTLRELGLDSLGFALVITLFCTEFDIQFETLGENFGDLRTVDDLLAIGECIVEKRNGEASNG